jgi:hypothetical protein
MESFACYLHQALRLGRLLKGEHWTNRPKGKNNLLKFIKNKQTKLWISCIFLSLKKCRVNTVRRKMVSSSKFPQLSCNPWLNEHLK